jgi:hypothetical protein
MMSKAGLSAGEDAAQCGWNDTSMSAKAACNDPLAMVARILLVVSKSGDAARTKNFIVWGGLRVPSTFVASKDIKTVDFVDLDAIACNYGVVNDRDK